MSGCLLVGGALVLGFLLAGPVGAIIAILLVVAVSVVNK